MATSRPLIAIVGPTASGKTAVAIELAKLIDGEIICADSRTVYREMNIGTAKPTPDEQNEVPHWGIDLVHPGERFTAKNFKDYADQKIREIRNRGKYPMLVGGTGLYISGVVYDYKFDSAYDERLRTQLAKLTVGELQKRCINNNIRLPENITNKRYLIRAIEKNSTINNANSKFDTDTIVVGIVTKRDELRQRIRIRAEHLFQNNVVEEAMYVGEKYGWNNESMTGNIYGLVKNASESLNDMAELKKQFAALDWKLAKRQMTWFKRDKNIVWLEKENVVPYVSAALEVEH